MREGKRAQYICAFLLRSALLKKKSAQHKLLLPRLWSAAEEKPGPICVGKPALFHFTEALLGRHVQAVKVIFVFFLQTCSALPQPTFEPIILLNMIIEFHKWPRKARIPLLEIITRDILRQKVKWLVRATNAGVLGVSHLLLITFHPTLTIPDGSAVSFWRLTGETDTYGSDPPCRARSEAG